jgi:hypothetical protein
MTVTTVDNANSAKGLAEFTPPQIERHGGEIAFVAGHQAINQVVDCGESIFFFS